MNENEMRELLGRLNEWDKWCVLWRVRWRMLHYRPRLIPLYATLAVLIFAPLLYFVKG